MEADRPFQAADIKKIFGIKRSRLRWWLASSFVEASIQEPAGPGKHALFSRQDLYRIFLFDRLMDSGFYREDARLILLKHIDFTRVKAEGLKYYNMKRVPNSTRWVGGMRETADHRLVDDEFCGISINLAMVIKEVDKRIKEKL